MLKDMGPFRRAALKQYISQMSTTNPKVVFDDHVAEIIRQQGFEWEEDPRSIYDPQQLYTALERYATDWSDFEIGDECLHFGFTMAYKIFAKPKAHAKLGILSDEQVTKTALKLSKSSGLPMLTTKLESLGYSFDREQQVRKRLKAPNPCVAYKRTQQGGKTRLVWGYPLEMTIMEARFARPLIDQFKSMRTPMAFGISKCDLGSYIHRYIIQDPGTIVALDYSKFDTSLSKLMIKEAFRILKTWFSDDDIREFGWHTIVSYFIQTPIVMPDGHLYRGKDHGVPSGSYFTQLVDSICNVALCFALSKKFDLDLWRRSLFVLGDDALLNVRGKVDLEAWAKYLAKFGMKLNVKKTMVGKPHFLGAYWDKGKPDVPIMEITKKAVFPETYRHYEGKPREGAESVLRSYASSYLSAVRMLPFRGDMRRVDLSGPADVDTRYLSGSDKYLSEEGKLGREHNMKAYLPGLSIRILL